MSLHLRQSFFGCELCFTQGGTWRQNITTLSFESLFRLRNQKNMSSASHVLSCPQVYSASLPRHLRLGCRTYHGRPSESPAKSSYFQHAARRWIHVGGFKANDVKCESTQKHFWNWECSSPDWKVNLIQSRPMSLMYPDVSRFFIELWALQDSRLMMVIWTFYQCPSLPCPLLLDLADTGAGCRRATGCRAFIRFCSRSQRFPVACPVRMVGVEPCAGEPSWWML